MVRAVEMVSRLPTVRPSAGAKGPLVEEEARLFKLRQEVEGEAREEFQRARLQLEDEARSTASGKLCATPFGVDVVGITEVIALTGALVGGPPSGSRSYRVTTMHSPGEHPTCAASAMDWIAHGSFWLSVIASVFIVR